MNRFKAAALTGVIGAAMFATAPAFAATGTPTTPGQATTTTPAKPLTDRTCGKITAIGSDSLTLLVGADSMHIKLGDKTRFVARSLAAARHGMHEGDYAAARGGDDRDAAAAHVVVWGEENFCKAAPGNISHYRGIVTDVGLNSLTFTDQNKNPVTVKLTQETNYFVDGKKVEKRPTFTNGERVLVAARESPDGSLTALRIGVKS